MAPIKNPVKGALEAVLSTSPDHVAIVRVGFDVDHSHIEGHRSDFASMYATHLAELMNSGEVGYFVDTRTHWFEQTGTFLLPESRGVKTILDLVRDCPEGGVLDAINESYRTTDGGGPPNYDSDLGGQRKFPAFLNHIKAQTRSILEVEFDPVIMQTSCARQMLKYLVPNAHINDSCLATTYDSDFHD